MLLIKSLPVRILRVGCYDAAAGVDYGSQSVFVEEDLKVLRLASLCPVARHKDIGMRHQLPRYLPLLRIGSSHYGSHIAVGSVHGVLSPLTHLVGHMLVQRSAVHQPVLKLPAGGIGGLHQHEYPSVTSVAHIHEGLHSVAPKIGIHCGEILVEGLQLLLSDLYLTQMSYGVGLRGGAYIASLHVTDHDQSLFMTVVHRLLVCRKSRDAELLVHRYLRLHRRDQIICGIHDGFVERQHGFRRCIETLSLFLCRSPLQLFRHELQIGIQSHDYRCLLIGYLIYQSGYHRFSCLRIPVSCRHSSSAPVCSSR